MKSRNNKTTAKLLEALKTAGNEGLEVREWREKCGNINEDTFKSARGRLKKDNLVELRGRKWVAAAEEMGLAA